MERPAESQHMRRPIRKHLTASDCQALTQSREGSSPLTQPFSQRRTSRDLNRGLYPWHGTRRQRRGWGVQKTIKDYFQVKDSQCTRKAEEVKAIKTEMDFSAADDEMFCGAVDDCSTSLGGGARLGHLQPVPLRKRSFSSRGNGSQEIGLWKWGGGAKPMGSGFSQPPSECSENRQDLEANDGKRSTGKAKQLQKLLKTDVFDFSTADDEMFCRVADDFSACLDGGPQMDSFEHAPVPKRLFSSRGHGSQIMGRRECDRNATRPIVARFSHPSSEHLESTEEPDACFGLLGTSFPQTKSRGNWIQLPDEVLMNIFVFLPVMDLYQNICLVCHHWRRLVNDPLFIPWKKLYYQYIKRQVEAVEKVDKILQNFFIRKEEELCVLNFIRYVATIKCSRRMDLEAVLTCLKNHHLYTKAEACITKMVPDLNTTPGTANVWAVIAAIVLLSDRVWDIAEVMSCLQKPSSTLSVSDVTEVLYCMAILLYAMREKAINISNRIHYNIFYCLNQLENANPVSRLVKNRTPNYQSDAWLRNRSAIQLTNEQQQILNHEIAPGQVVKIMAFAGTGKTSTLIKYAEKRPHLKFLYATFNKSISVQASQLFPSNVECRTFHSIAFQHVGKLYFEKKKLNSSKLTAFTINCVLPKGKAGFIRAKMVAQTIEAFFASADEAISTEHVPIWCNDTHGKKVLVEHEEQQFAVREAEKIWEKMKLPMETRTVAYKMTHDGYLKEWQLRKPQLRSYDAIFVDEAQDCTPAIMNIVLSQSCGKIFVGDPHQQIYTFRGAVNALFEVEHTHIFYLTQSFRFGAEIAYVGATILDVAKKLRNKTLVGGMQDGSINGDCEGQIAILSRSNSYVFAEAVRVTEGEKPARIHLIGGPKNFGLDKILDIWILLQPEEERIKKCLFIKDYFIRMWSGKEGGFRALKQYAMASDDKELESKIAVVEKFNVRIPELVNRIYQCHTPDSSFADYVLGTVHKAKGMEFDTVQITDDFVKLTCAKHNLSRIPFRIELFPEDEWNLLYVAATRAKKCLVMTKSLENILTLAGEYFLRAEQTSDVINDGALKCSVAVCSNTVPADTVLTMKKLPMSYSDTHTDKGGYLCPSCVEQRLGQYTYLAAEPSLVKSMAYTLENVVIPNHLLVLMQVI